MHKLLNKNISVELVIYEHSMLLDCPKANDEQTS